MDLRMAVLAGPAQQETVARIVLDIFAGVRSAGMVGRRMTLLAQQGWSLDQQKGVIAAMGPMAERAVFRDRRVFPQERTTLFCVAAVAGLINR